MFDLIESFCCVTFDQEDIPTQNRSRGNSFEQKMSNEVDTKRS